MEISDKTSFVKKTQTDAITTLNVELVDVDIRTGKFIVKPLENEDFQKLREKGHDLDLGYDYDFDYTQCLDIKKKPVTLAA